MHWATMFILLVLVLISVQLGLVWLALVIGFVIVLWMMSKAGGAVWGGTKAVGRGVKGELDREYKTMEANTGKYPDSSVWAGVGKKNISKAADWWTVHSGPDYGDPKTLGRAKRTHEKIELKQNTGTAIGNACKSFLDACGKIFKK
jgi:hypothetical protein